MIAVRAAGIVPHVVRSPRHRHRASPKIAVPTSRSVLQMKLYTRVQAKKDEREQERDEDGLYYGEYSNFWSDPDQFKGIVVFSAVLAAFFSLGNLGAAILLPWLYNKPIDLCFQAIVLGYPCGQ